MSDPDGTEIVLHNVALSITLDGEEWTEIRLLFHLDDRSYHHVDRHACFHLQPDVRGQIFAGGFEPDISMEIGAS